MDLAEPRRVDVWRIGFNTAADWLMSEETLSAEERERAGGFRFDRDQRRFVMSHCFLRRVLAGYLGVAPEHIAFHRGALGKPSLAENESLTEFNLSHWSDGCAVAVADGTEVGIDGEARRAIAELDLMSRSMFSRTEIDALKHAGAHRRDDVFLECWTRREAVLKAAGTGLAEAPRDVSVPIGPDVDGIAWVSREPGQARAYRVRDLSKDGVIAAVALADAGPMTIRECVLQDRGRTSAG